MFGPLGAGILWVVELLTLGFAPIVPMLRGFFAAGRNLTAGTLVYVVTFGLSLRLLHQTVTGFRGFELLHFSALFVGLTLTGEALARWGAPFGPNWGRLLALLPLASLLLSGIAWRLLRSAPGPEK